MSPDVLTLQEIVSQHPEQTLVISDSEKLTPENLCTAGLAIREQHPELASKCVAIQFETPLLTIIHLIALDGFADRILLLPPDLTGAKLNDVAKVAGTDILLTVDALLALPHAKPHKPATGHTEWLFTTSGTSGSPKVFSHSLKSLVSTIKIGRGPNYRWGLAYQAHRFAGIQVILQALTSGMVLVTSSSTNTPEQARLFVAHRINALSATPSQWRNFLMQGQISRCKLQQITLGGEIADQAVLTSLRKHFPDARIAHIYASTEAGVGFSVTDGLAGFPAEWLKRDATVKMNISENGTLQIKGPGISSSASLHSRLTTDGYLDTLDCVKLEHGRVYFLGRDSGIINVGGNKVHPEEIENLVLSLPEVQQARVSAIASALIGQLVSLDVQTRPLSKEEQVILKARILSHCKMHLEKYKIPALIRFVDAITVSDTGKLERKKLG